MPKELLFEMMNRKLFFELAATGLLFIINWLLLFSLARKILCVKLTPRFLPAALFMALYSPFATQFIPPFYFHLLAPLLVILLLSWMTKEGRLFQITWTGLMVVISQGIGLVFVNTLRLLDPNSAAFG